MDGLNNGVEVSFLTAVTNEKANFSIGRYRPSAPLKALLV